MTLPSQSFGTKQFPATFTVEDSATLQFTDMAGGNNKFYVLELHNAGSEYRLYSCYGRTGSSGVKEERFPDDERTAKKEFASIKASKIKKGYKEVLMASTSRGTDAGNSKIISTDVRQSEKLVVSSSTSKRTLEPRLSQLVQRLYAEAGNTCQSQLSGRLETSTKNPLGTLTLTQIEKGKSLLQDINDAMLKLPTTCVKTHNGYDLNEELIQLSSEFYATIPQEIPLRPRDEDGRKRWLDQYCIHSTKALDEKRDLLDLLADVQGMMTGFDSDDIGTKYEEMECQFDYADANAFKQIQDYIVNSQSSHHGWKLNVKNVWRVNSRAQTSYRTKIDSIGNVRQLFHGSRASNILGICRKGLLLRPPGAYVTGSMFGNGLYFADQSTKSSQYATARFGGSSGSGDSYFMFVADVALGKIKEYDTAQTHLNSAPTGFHSVKGVQGRSLMHNEYIVYDVKQEQLQYLVEFTQSYR